MQFTTNCTHSFIFWNNKGGVGKTTLAFQSLCEHALDNPKKKFMVVDCDAQANMSAALLGSFDMVEQIFREDRLRIAGGAGSGRPYARGLFSIFELSNALAAGRGVLRQLNDNGFDVRPIHVAEVRTVERDILQQQDRGEGNRAEADKERREKHRPRGGVDFPDNIWLIPAHPALDRITGALNRHINQDDVLKFFRLVPKVVGRAMEELDKASPDKSQDHGWEVFADAGPSWSILTHIAMFACDSLVLVCKADDFTVQGCRNMFNLIYGTELSPLDPAAPHVLMPPPPGGVDQPFIGLVQEANVPSVAAVVINDIQARLGGTVQQTERVIRDFIGVEGTTHQRPCLYAVYATHRRWFNGGNRGLPQLTVDGFKQQHIVSFYDMHSCATLINRFPVTMLRNAGASVRGRRDRGLRNAHELLNVLHGLPRDQPRNNPIYDVE